MSIIGRSVSWQWQRSNIPWEANEPNIFELKAVWNKKKQNNGEGLCVLLPYLVALKKMRCNLAWLHSENCWAVTRRARWKKRRPYRVATYHRQSPNTKIEFFTPSTPSSSQYQLVPRGRENNRARGVGYGSSPLTDGKPAKRVTFLIICTDVKIKKSPIDTTTHQWLGAWFRVGL